MNQTLVHDYLLINSGREVFILEKLQVASIDSAELTYIEFMETYATEVYRFCCTLTYCEADAEDLFQDTFLQIYRTITNPHLHTAPRKYIYSTAVYLWKSAKRKYARRQRIAPEQPLHGGLTQPETGFEEEIERVELYAQVRKLVDELPDKLRIPVILHYTAGLSVSDVARALGIVEGTVKSRLHKARQVIKKGLVKLNANQ